jgi:hypothetical protein
MENLEIKFKQYLQDKVFLEVLDLVRQNSNGKIWVMGGFLYKNLATILYGGKTYNYDIDFIVEDKMTPLKEAAGWEIQTNSYGNQNYVREKNKMSFTDLKKAIRVNGFKNKTIEEYVKGTPLNIQSIAYDLEENKIIGEKGIKALLSKTIKINNAKNADFYAKMKGKKLGDIIKEKAKELDFTYILGRGYFS